MGEGYWAARGDLPAFLTAPSDDATVDCTEHVLRVLSHLAVDLLIPIGGDDTLGYAAHLAVVEVDTGLGTVTPIRIVAAHDVGRAINPMLVEGQVHGGVAQGLGMALMEEYIPGRTENLHDYLIPTIGDVPPIETLIIEEADAHGPYGAKGLGEHALIPTAPALLNAIRHATGVRLTRVPATPSRVHDALKKARS